MASIERLLHGYRRFHEKYFHREPGLFASLAAKGQSPEVAVVACCDSRVDPAIIMDCEPGDLFTIRNVANLVPPYAPDSTYHSTSAALEFAVRGLGVKHILVLGHAQCGGIRALLEDDRTGVAQGEFVTAWMSIAHKARDQIKCDKSVCTIEEQAQQCEKAAIRISLDNLMSFPWIRERVLRGDMQLHGWYFDLESGELMCLDSKRGVFTNQCEAAHAGSSCS